MNMSITGGLVLGLCAAVSLGMVETTPQLPPGTVIPVQLKTALNAEKDKVDKKIIGSVMQEVSLPDGDRIKEGARITGHIVRVNKPGSSPSSISLRFDAIED
jgi:hypothetical protein